ncbi:hypothetical protein K435DRAFT_740276 [Dendrothele bispora CBS 962.96]|uniref:Pentacotripeptide-repeat region of PRORP domain-containing protein n=1 Tax=Dendrothele bispora (strain CBS 962.96) TaxID=1314807 RepID=A0A4S8MYB6_DENBC|nr:hypothetical protein K435DRAFT_740276 [Dendrothele bispora CBS 962.96]
MLEPVAAVILNTVVLCGRSHPERSAPLRSVVKIMKTTSSRSITSDFFIPQPRRVKGKEKATGYTDDVCHVLFPSQCTEWSCNVMVIPKPCRWVIPKELHPTKERLFRRPLLPRSTPSIRRHPSSSRIVGRRSHSVVAQMRHASGMPDTNDDESIPDSEPMPSSYPSSPDPSPSSKPTSSRTNYSTDAKLAIIYRLRGVIRAPTSELDMDKTWKVYDAVIASRAENLLNVPDMLAFCDKVLTFAEIKYDANLDVDTLKEWGRRLRDMASNLEPRIAPMSLYDYWRRCSLARAWALMGQPDDAIGLLDDIRKIPLTYEETSRTIHVYRAIVSSLYLYHGAPAVVDFLVKEWAHIGSYLSKANKWHHTGHSEAGHLLRKTTHELISRIERPQVLFTDRVRQDWDPEHRRILGELLILCYCSQKLPLSALDVYHEMQRLSIGTPINIKLLIVRALVQEDALGLAKELFASVPDTTLFKYYLQTALFLFAHDGDSERAESYYNQLVDQAWVNEVDVAMLLHSYATQGRTEQVCSLFDSFFPFGEDGERLNMPSKLHYSIAIYAHAQIGDVVGINKWLGAMAQARMSPDVYVFTIVLQAFAKRGEMDHVGTVLTQMREHGIPPNVVTYTNIMTLLAHRKDPMGAEVIYKRAVRDGVVPDRRMINALMNAHVESGSWKGVIRVFDYVHSNPKINIRLTIEVYNTLLKAYVLIGAPFRIVLRLFRKLENSQVKPDSYTYALLIQSACDSGKMEIASDIFHEMDQKASWQSHLHIDVYIMTILMAGYLRGHHRRKARAIYEEMQKRGIQPTAVTFRAIIQAYGNERSEKSIQVAEEFVNALMSVEEKPWITPAYGRATALELVYGPLLNGYTKKRQPEEVERVFQEYLDAGGSPTLGTLTALLNTYRKSFNIEACLQLWPQIFELGLKHTTDRPLFDSSDDDDPSRNRLQANILCVPLSIYIDALSSAGMHLEIAAVWKRFQVQGFIFDSHNWNHLAVALIRAGEPVRAFQIIEKVILPYQLQSRQLVRDRDENPNSPLAFDEERDSADVGSHEQRTSTYRRYVNIWRTSRRIRGIVEIEGDPETGEIPDHDNDFAHPLHILHQISPSWNMWCPHRFTLRIFLQALSRLRSGYIIPPAAPGQQMSGRDLEDPQNRQVASETVERIYTECPETVQLLRRFDAQEHKRLGRKYDLKYTYV